MSLFSTWKDLRKQGVMGINQRNADYVLRYNQRHLYPLVDDKIKTKERAEQAGIHVPPMYGVIDSDKQISQLAEIVDGHRDFVIKPAQGAGGDGIIVIVDQFEGYYRTASGRLLSREDLEFHLSGILSGIYSLGGHRDRALIEFRVTPDPIFSAISYEGVPDIRIIVLKGYPLLAMLRLPTRQSGGKANLHQGAIGVGVDLATGITLDGTWLNKLINSHPDTTNPVRGVQLPYWNGFMSLATRCYELTGLGYLGVDMVLDKDKGPLMLELNARPGLNIQIANNAGLAARCATVEAEIERLALKGIHKPSPDKRLAFCQREFSQTSANLSSETFTAAEESQTAVDKH
ncbi:Ribosomal protein S6--L-glutamate ligase [Zhongshania aliphaticivorans]|uniref:Ribosomal protein S6--L-glutamate ligase n=1 Tax=Zhongshania aliphaticivorans TaxID=1470434 RepID=A0A5S9PKW8_9GAMM|nr:alpha-L-glutamate ligase-like protein [Zhongshania aliphaticivorans]CAA0104941.1 Ribosomal protein S6--L-glutamate ligase [Zhongshania aliphaticivorans]CAA0105236.1 Ribosomal protein S6--L-glutamate ligase [Zhongshania aliphaticivorans]